jgi:hypothetical protein
LSLGPGGADAALLYESCVLEQQPERFGPIFARASAAATLALAVLTLAGGALAQIASFDVAWAAEVLLCVGGLGIALAMIPVPPVVDPNDDEPERSFGAPSLDTLARLIVPTALASVLFASFELVVPAAWPLGGSLVVLTSVVAGAAIAESGGALVAARAGRQTSLRTLGLAALGLALIGMLAPIAAFWGLAFVLGWARPLCAEAIQRLSRPGERARAASWAGVIEMASNAVLLPVAAALLARQGELMAVGLIVLIPAASWAMTSVLAARRRAQ